MKKTLIAIAATLPMCAFAQTDLEKRLDALQNEVEQLKKEIAESKKKSAQEKAEAPEPAQDTTLFGYGEFNYNRFRDANRTSKADLRRFVLGVSHRFSDRLTFNSELELEHAVSSAGDQGEVEVEQAWLNYQFSDALNVKGGLFLIPLGVLNETHEPPTYYGVERNEVETRIIPTTWRELGFGLHGLVNNVWRYDVGVTTGFNAGKLDDPSQGFRSLHQEGQLADARGLSVYGSLNYRRPGLQLGGGLFTGNTGQNGQADPLLRGVNARLMLWDLHGKWSANGWDLQALYARGSLGDAAKINAFILATNPAPFAAPRQLKGWYGQAAYHLWRSGDWDFAPFARLERFEIRQQEDPANGLLQDPNNLSYVRTVGFNLRLHPQVVFKSDFQRYSTDHTRDRFNVGLGYMF